MLTQGATPLPASRSAPVRGFQVSVTCRLTRDALSAGRATVCCLLYVAFRYTHLVLKPLGEAGTVILMRLSAFILLCLGVQIVWDGASELLRS
jgi:small neutral amino acid transporter SnatA (MarC family)